LPAAIAFHEVIPEALAAWYDYVIVEQKGSAALDEARLSVPIAIVDIGGRTTDFVVVKDQGVVHGASGSLQCGMLDVKQQVANGIQERFDLETLGEQRVAQAVEKQSVRLHGKDYDIGPLVRSAKQQVVERIHAETRRPPATGPRCRTGSHPVRRRGNGGPGRGYRQLVPEPGRRRAPSCVSAWQSAKTRCLDAFFLITDIGFLRCLSCSRAPSMGHLFTPESWCSRHSGSMLPRSFFSIITLYVDFGVAESSRADEAITQRLKEALALIDVRVIDHFVVTAGAFVSFAERGLI
jgi:hypothetical protein